MFTNEHIIKIILVKQIFLEYYKTKQDIPYRIFRIFYFLEAKMLHKVIHKLESIPATIIGGFFLVGSFITSHTEIKFPFDFGWITIFISGLPLLYSAIRKLIFNKGISKISSALLISIAMISAIAIGDLFAAAEVAFIMAIGGILEEKTTAKAKQGLKKLINLTPTQGRKIENENEILIPADQIKLNDIIRILPGEVIPVDGIIINGETSVNQSIMTGESLPIDKIVGDEVFCGTINCFGTIDIKATKVGEDSSLQKLIQLVKEAENKKSPIQRIADKWASVLVPIALIIAIITLIITKDITRAVTILVVFCPCALVLATPTAIMAGIGQATKHGIIIKSGEALEKMGKVDTITFDKTGTLTFGKLEVSDIIPFQKFTKDELLSLTASAENKSEHPLAKAILEFAKKENIKIFETTEFKMTSGKGILATVLVNDVSKKIICGNEKFLNEHNIKIEENIFSQLEQLRLQGKAVILIAEENYCIGAIALSDVLRSDVSKIINNLNSINVNSVLLTGDNKKTAQYFANLAGIKNIFSELLPEQKVEQIINLQNENKTVCMIGDGINDAPALKTADVGIAMGTIGSDIAIDSADIALMQDDISKLPYLKRLSNATVKTIKISISLSMFINFLAIILSVLGLLNPTTGALVHNAGSIFVIMFAAFLYDRKFDK